jgi:hypothetical protein
VNDLTKLPPGPKERTRDNQMVRKACKSIPADNAAAKKNLACLLHIISVYVLITTSYPG